MPITVPADNSNLNEYLEEVFNQSDLVTKKCEDGCNKIVQAQKRSQLVCGKETPFITVILSRWIETEEGFDVNRHRISSIDEVFIR